MANEKPNAGLERVPDSDVPGYFQEKLQNIETQLAMGAGQEHTEAYAKLLLEKANALQGLNRKGEMWGPARRALETFVANDAWDEAATACEMMYQSEHPDAIKALVHGVWLAIAFPVDPELTVTLLNYVVDETPPTADGAAVAAAVARYVAGLRATDEAFKTLNFATLGLIAHVAKRHSGVQTQDQLDAWMTRLKLDDPAVFLPRMAMVLEAIVPRDQWWFDRDALRARMPH